MARISLTGMESSLGKLRGGVGRVGIRVSIVDILCCNVESREPCVGLGSWLSKSDAGSNCIYSTTLNFGVLRLVEIDHVTR